MNVLTILLTVCGVALVVAFALWDVAADLLSSIVSVVLRAVTFGRVRLSADGDYTRALGISAITLMILFVAFVIIASRVH